MDPKGPPLTTTTSRVSTAPAIVQDSDTAPSDQPVPAVANTSSRRPHLPHLHSHAGVRGRRETRQHLLEDKERDRDGIDPLASRHRHSKRAYLPSLHRHAHHHHHQLPDLPPSSASVAAKKAALSPLSATSTTDGASSGASPLYDRPAHPRLELLGAELQSAYDSLTHLALSRTRTLDDAHYGLLEQLANVKSSLGALKDLCRATNKLHKDFERDVRGLARAAGESASQSSKEDIDTEDSNKEEDEDTLKWNGARRKSRRNRRKSAKFDSGALGQAALASQSSATAEALAAVESTIQHQSGRVTDLESRLSTCRKRAERLSSQLLHQSQKLDAAEELERRWWARVSRRLKFMWAVPLCVGILIGMIWGCGRIWEVGMHGGVVNIGTGLSSGLLEATSIDHAKSATERFDREGNVSRVADVPLKEPHAVEDEKAAPADKFANAGREDFRGAGGVQQAQSEQADEPSDQDPLLRILDEL